MHEQGKKLLNLMFRPGETVCVSPNKFGYHSIPLENAMAEECTLVPTQDSCDKRNIPWDENAFEHPKTDTLLLVALNPIKGFREDSNCYKFRNFLVEMDNAPLAQQLAYAKSINLPYSAVVFSGSKSLHFLISLDTDIPDEKSWRTMAEWTLKIATAADQLTKNPSRSIRIPGAFREPGKQQQLVEFRGPTKLQDFVSWLKQYPEAKPEETKKRQVSEEPDFTKVRPWVKKRLAIGLDPNKGRNVQWYAIAYEFALAGYSEDDTLDVLEKYFTPDRDFREKEWKTSIKSAFKNVYKRK